MAHVTEEERSAVTPLRATGSSTHDQVTTDYVDQCIRMLISAGLRVTAPRRTIISYFSQAKRPVTVAQLCEELGDLTKGKRQLSKVSIYRVIADLERLQLLHRKHPSGGYVACTHVGCAVHSHVIVTCHHCGDTREEEVPHEYLGPLFFFLKSRGNHLPSLPVLRLEGTCNPCHREREVSGV